LGHPNITQNTTPELLIKDLAKLSIISAHNRRTGKLVERVRLYNAEAASNIQDHHVLRHIPQDQIDRTLGVYALNPGYPAAGGG